MIWRDDDEIKLTPRERAFVNAWLGEGHGNASLSARLAGYAESGSHVQGARLLRRANVQAEIDRRWQAEVMTTNEVLSRLARQARASIALFLDDDGRLDRTRLLEHGDLVRALVPTEHGYRVELHDAQAALELIGKSMLLFGDKRVVMNPDGSALLPLDKLVDALRAADEVLAGDP